MDSPEDKNENDRVYLVSSPVDLSPTIDLRRWLVQFWRGKWKLLVTSVLGMVLGFASSFIFDPVYRSETTISPVTDDNSRGLSGLGSQLGGIALAGLNIGPSDSHRAEAIAVLKSRVLVEQLIMQEALLPVLFPQQWDENAQAWTAAADEVPTLEDAYTVFDQDIRRVDEDASTGLVSVAIRWSDPGVAAEWARKLVESANSRLRQKAIEEARSSITFLQSELETTSAVGIQQVIISLMESQMNQITLANSRPEYAFRTIDPPTVSDIDRYIWPDRGLLAKLGLLLGLILGFVWVLMSAPAVHSEE
jgi:uncharacterized protein involved in exopolysaccharide biosynthesis